MSLTLDILFFFIFFFKQKTAYEMRISDWSSERVLFRSEQRIDALRLVLALHADKIEFRGGEAGFGDFRPGARAQDGLHAVGLALPFEPRREVDRKSVV